MASNLPSFNKEFQPQIINTLNTVVDNIQKKTNEAKSLEADAAERLLEDACNDCVRTFQVKMEEIKATAKRAKPDPASPTYQEDNKKYAEYVTAVAHGIDNTKSFFNNIFERIRNIVSTVITGIRTGGSWLWDQITESFNSIRSLWSS